MNRISTARLKSCGIFLMVALALPQASCRSGIVEGAVSEVALPTDFVEIKTDSCTIKKYYPGMMEGIVNVDVKSQATGYLEAIYVKEGDYVKKGQPLFKIKSDITKEQVSGSEAALMMAKASQESAALEVEKLKPLVASHVVSEMQMKEAMAKYSLAKAQVAQAKSVMESSKLSSNFSLISAPVGGFIGRIPSRTGNLVTPSDPNPLTTLSDISTVLVYFSFSEAEYLSYMKGKGSERRVELLLADGSCFHQTGTIEVASGSIDRQTGSIAMKAQFPNSNHLLRSGGSARVAVSETLADVLKVPLSSVRDIQDKYFVFKLMSKNRVSMVPIDVVGKSGNYYLVRSGLSSGDKIAINRLDALSDSMLVAPAITSHPRL